MFNSLMKKPRGYKANSLILYEKKKNSVMSKHRSPTRHYYSFPDPISKQAFLPL